MFKAILLSISIFIVTSSYTQTVGIYVGQARLSNITSNCASAFNCSLIGDADFTNAPAEIPVGSVFTGTWNTGLSYLPYPSGPEMLLVNCHTLIEVWSIRLKLSNGTMTSAINYMMNVNAGNINWNISANCPATNYLIFGQSYERAVTTVNFESFAIPPGLGVSGVEFTLVSDGAGDPDPAGILLLQNVVPLPVTFNDFNFSCEEKDLVTITWETLSENNCDYYIVQTSKDGETYVDYSTINGVGTTTSKTDYQLDLPRTNQNEYVKIVQVDKNGEVSSVYGPFLIDCKTEELELYPNPTSDEINIIGSKNDGESELVLFDLESNIVMNVQHNFKKEQMISLDLTDLSSGVYCLKISTVKKVEFKRIVKN